MKLNIDKSKTRMVGIRLSEQTYQQIQKIAKKEQVPQTEVCRALIDGALKELEE